MEIPAIPVVTARRTFAPTSAGSIANPPSKSALIGISTLRASSSKWASASASETPLSARPLDHANPELVVARALKPSRAR